MTQSRALSILKTGENVFLTGEPGSGKTHTVNAYIEYLREYGVEAAITASTGIAATHLGGMTIHSWSGIGIKKILSEQDLDELTTRERLVSRVSRAKVLIIDEISMLDADTLTAVDAACRALRRKEEPFGGLQVIFVGDFFQLPPVNRERDFSGGVNGSRSATRFAFQAFAWKEARPLVCYLSEQHRQDDENFLTFLGKIRSGLALENGMIADDVHDILTERIIELEGGQTSEADEPHDNKLSQDFTRLFSHNINVDEVNDRRLGTLYGAAQTFKMETHGSETLVTQLKKGCLSPEILSLKIGARVMFTKNSPESGFVNGTLGTVKGFGIDGNPIVTVAKRGGHGNKNGNKGNMRHIDVIPMEWTINDGARTLARVKQIPLRLAWAMTIHKSQGATLDEAVIDLSKAFEYGQGYVALSRVRSFEGLSLVGYNTRALEVHPEILLVDADFRMQSEKAGKIFEKLATADHEKMMTNFILASGGKIEKISPQKLAKVRVEKEKKKRGIATHLVTLEFFNQGKSLEEIANERGLTVGTIISHFEILLGNGEVTVVSLGRLISPEFAKEVPIIQAAFLKKDSSKTGGGWQLAPIFHKLQGQYTYEEIRLARLVADSAESGAAAQVHIHMALS